MRTRKLGPLDVSIVGLGCNNFGGRIDEAASVAVIDAAIGAGVAFFDTADVYGNKGGSETIIGNALRGRRDQVVLATKFGADMGEGIERHGARSYIHAAFEASLRRLQTDLVELYQQHQEDRGTPLEETFAALKELVDQGAVRAVGTSNYEPDRVAEAAKVAADLGVPYVSEQSEYSWLHRDPEAELLAVCARAGVGFIPYFPLASGLLTGKVHRDAPPAEGTRLHGREIPDADLEKVERLRGWADAHDVSLLEVAIGGLLAVAPVASVIAGATKPAQVEANAQAGEWQPTDAELDEIRALV
ncbi:MAG: hypothetical protein QOH23_491 [Gaiellaceae bacterium]|nr:hypothetical protein [Gaiellaceae bacterium]